MLDTMMTQAKNLDNIYKQLAEEDCILKAVSTAITANTLQLFNLTLKVISGTIQRYSFKHCFQYYLIFPQFFFFQSLLSCCHIYVFQLIVMSNCRIELLNLLIIKYGAHANLM